MLIDTHCHLVMMAETASGKAFSLNDTDQINKIIQEAMLADVTFLVNVSANLTDSVTNLALAKKFPNIFTSIGIHPSDCTDHWQKDIQQLAALAEQHESIVAIGECGLDYHYPEFSKENQKKAFKAHIELAIAHDKAIIVHTRDAQDEALKILQEYRSEKLRVVFHCFSESLAVAQAIVQEQYFIGIGGSITYPKNTALRMVASTIPLENIVLETDAPFLPPQPFRGTLNHPRYIAFIAQYLADLRKVPLTTVASQTTQNAVRLFGLKI